MSHLFARGQNSKAATGADDGVSAVKSSRSSPDDEKIFASFLAASP